MTPKDKTRFAEIMFGLADNFGDEINKFGLKMRFEALKDYPIEKVEEAAYNLVKSRRYSKMPTTAEFIEAIDGKPDDRAEIQADVVLDQIRTVGSYGSPTFSDPVTAYIVSHKFGWGNLCRTITEANRKWFVQEFKEAYQAYQGQKHLIEGPAPKRVLELVKGIGEAKRKEAAGC